MATINPVQLKGLTQEISRKGAEGSSTNAPKFSETLKDMINQVDQMQSDSAQKVENFMAGTEGNIHEVMAAVEEARLSFQLMMEIRNKLLDSYQEVMRMQV